VRACAASHRPIRQAVRGTAASKLPNTQHSVRSTLALLKIRRNAAFALPDTGPTLPEVSAPAGSASSLKGTGRCTGPMSRPPMETVICASRIATLPYQCSPPLFAPIAAHNGIQQTHAHNCQDPRAPAAASHSRCFAAAALSPLPLYHRCRSIAAATQTRSHPRRPPPEI